MAGSLVLRWFLSGVVVLLLPSCADFECGYGGPGCGEPGLRVCEGPYVPGQTYAALATFFDDTGPHPATVNAFSTASPGVLSLAEGGAQGRLTISTLDAGRGLVTLDVKGWKGTTFTWALEVTRDAGPPPDAGPFPFMIPGGLADGGSCVASALSLVR